MSHGITKCRSCGATVMQCRCPGPHTVRYVVSCANCPAAYVPPVYSPPGDDTASTIIEAVSDFASAVADALPDSTPDFSGAGDFGGGGASGDF